MRRTRNAICSLALALACGAVAAATLFHHIHNAEFLHDYPNLPAWLSRAGVYAAWLIATAIGVIGYRLRHRGLLVLYACYALDGLVHYALAPMSAHTPMMNTTIWLEAAAGAALLIMVFRRRTE
ncbi:MAG TPA: hypothetical protein VIG70_00035 [Burkholderiales bacterium]|jgi:hypothetical protein